MIRPSANSESYAEAEGLTPFIPWIRLINADTYITGTFYFAEVNDRITRYRISTAGMPISYTVGCRHNFCCRGPILIPRPDSETSAQTTLVNVLDSFVKPNHGISASYTKRR